MNYQTVQCGRIPLLVRRGGCGINKKARSHRSAADGVVAHKSHFRMRFERWCLSDHPVRAFSERDLFSCGAATPPHEEGNVPQIQTIQTDPLPKMGK